MQENEREARLPIVVDPSTDRVIRLLIESYQLVGRLYASGNTNSIVTATDTKIGLATKDFAFGITADTTNSRLTIQKPGKYFVCANVYYSVTTADKFYKVMIFKNGLVVSQAQYHSSPTSGLALHVSDIVNLVKDDYLELYTHHNAGVDQNVNSGQSLTYIAAHFIR